MPVFLIEFFGAAQLETAFWGILLMTAPAWAAMILCGGHPWVRLWARPWILPPLYCGVLFYLLWKSYEAALLPEPAPEVSYGAAQSFARHPVAFLALFCNLQILNLALGTMIFQKANKERLRAPLELALCWLVGAPAVLVFALRLAILRKALT